MKTILPPRSEHITSKTHGPIIEGTPRDTCIVCGHACGCRVVVSVELEDGEEDALLRRGKLQNP